MLRLGQEAGPHGEGILGTASATATSTAVSDAGASAAATAYGAAGYPGYPDTLGTGLGGAAEVNAYASSTHGGAVEADATGYGGNAPGNPTWLSEYSGLNGTSGQDETLGNAVGGYSVGGTIKLTQTAYGGSGGNGGDENASFSLQWAPQGWRETLILPLVILPSLTMKRTPMCKQRRSAAVVAGCTAQLGQRMEEMRPLVPASRQPMQPHSPLRRQLPAELGGYDEEAGHRPWYSRARRLRPR